MMNFLAALIAGMPAVLAGLLPVYVVRFSILGIPTNLFEVATWLLGMMVLSVSSVRAAWIAALARLPHAYKFWILGFIVASIVSTAMSSELEVSLGILKGWILTPMLLGSLVYVFGDRMQTIRMLALSGTVVALLGFSQLRGLNRVASLYDVPNSLALFLVPVAILTLFTGFQARNRLLLVFSIPMFVAIIATQSFGAIFALVVAVFFVIPLSKRWERVGAYPERSVGCRAGSRRSLPSSAPSTKAGLTFSPIGEKGVRNGLLIFIIAAIIFFALSGRISYILAPLTHSGATNSATVRLQLWDIGLDLIRKNPVFGIGLGQFEPAYQQELHRKFTSEDKEANAVISYRLQPEFVFRDPHNWIISFWLNTGLLGLLSFIALNYLAVKSLPSPIALALISILFFGLVDTIYWKNDLSALWWLLLLWGVNQHGVIINAQSV